jgi:uncharacterized phiE125 gp8 family phage protein
MTLVVATPATSEPVSIQEAVRQLRLGTDSGEEAIVKDMITAARRYLENYLGISLASQSLRYTIDEFPEVLKLPRGPVTSITTLQYYDTDGTQQSMNVSTDIITDLDSIPARVTPLSDASWPGTEVRINAVEVVYVAGYTSSNIPENLKTGILATIGHFYDNRGDRSVKFPEWILQIVSEDMHNLEVA